MLLAVLALASAFGAPCVVQTSPVEGELTFLRWENGRTRFRVNVRTSATPDGWMVDVDRPADAWGDTAPFEDRSQTTLDSAGRATGQEAYAWPARVAWRTEDDRTLFQTEGGGWTESPVALPPNQGSFFTLLALAQAVELPCTWDVVRFRDGVPDVVPLAVARSLAELPAGLPGAVVSTGASRVDVYPLGPDELGLAHRISFLRCGDDGCPVRDDHPTPVEEAGVALRRFVSALLRGDRTLEMAPAIRHLNAAVRAGSTVADRVVYDAKRGSDRTNLSLNRPRWTGPDTVAFETFDLAFHLQRGAKEWTVVGASFVTVGEPDEAKPTFELYINTPKPRPPRCEDVEWPADTTDLPIAQMRSDPDFRYPSGARPAECFATFALDSGHHPVDVQVSGCDEVFREATLRGLTGARFAPAEGATRYRLKLCFRE